METKKIFIYGLYTDGEPIRYIGKTGNVIGRLKSHVGNTKYINSKGGLKKTYKDYWIEKRIRDGREIKIIVLEETNIKNWEERERYWIAKLKISNKLTNSTDGGESGSPTKYLKTYDDIKLWVRTNTNCKSGNEWDLFIKENKLPIFIPRNPMIVYKNRGWISWGDFLGTGRISDNFVTYLSYEDSKLYIKNNYSYIKTSDEWKKIAKLNEIANEIPNRPDRYYKKRGWISWGDFLGTGNVNNKDRIYLSFYEAKNIVIGLKLKSILEWKKYHKNNKIKNIPNNPNGTYKNEGWISWGDFLGTGKISDNLKHDNFISLNEAKDYVRDNLSHIKTATKYKEHFNENDTPYFLPKNPDLSYKNSGWISWGDYLNSDTKPNKDKIFLEFNEARTLMRTYNLKSNKEWRLFMKEKYKKLLIPSAPDIAYKNKGWVSWGDFLGTGKVSNKNKVYLDFNSAKDVISNYKIKSCTEWYIFIKTKSEELSIPATPNLIYKEWISWDDWLSK